jgi:hypothetical protein
MLLTKRNTATTNENDSQKENKMTKAIKIRNSYNEVIAITDNVKQALVKIEKYSGCSLADTTSHHSVNRVLNEQGSDVVFNCFGVVFYLELITADSKTIQTEKRYLNAMQTAALFN